MIIATTKATNAQAGKAQIHCLKKFQISRERNIATPSTLYNLSVNAKKKKKKSGQRKKGLKKKTDVLTKKNFNSPRFCFKEEKVNPEL